MACCRPCSFSGSSSAVSITTLFLIHDEVIFSPAKDKNDVAFPPSQGNVCYGVCEPVGNDIYKMNT